ncbi:MAG: hypothetical protein IT545_09175, partial [Rhodobacteraceae bacterium]|nr:hypothetical protein [Paracoccaceae bacterium]
MTSPPPPPTPPPAARPGRRRAIRAGLVAAGLAAAALSARAGVETQILLRAPGWTVELRHDTGEGRLACAVLVANRRGQGLEILALDDGGEGLAVRDPGGQLAAGTLALRLEIGGRIVAAAGAGEGATITVLPAVAADGRALVAALAAAGAVVLRDGGGGWLAGFALPAAGAAAEGLAACARAIALPGAAAGREAPRPGSDRRRPRCRPR